jgi:hypothetical protein
MNVRLLAASAFLDQSGALFVSHNSFITFFLFSNVKPTQVYMCTSRPPIYFNNTSGNSMGIVNLNSAFEKVARLLEKKHTDSQYDKMSS